MIADGLVVRLEIFGLGIWVSLDFEKISNQVLAVITWEKWVRQDSIHPSCFENQQGACALELRNF